MLPVSCTFGTEVFEGLGMFGIMKHIKAPNTTEGEAAEKCEEH